MDDIQPTGAALAQKLFKRELIKKPSHPYLWDYREIFTIKL
jgi:hypothetical protein